MNMPMGMTGPMGGMPNIPGMPTGLPGMQGAPSPVMKIKEQIDNSKTILIVTHENPTFDSMGASLAMYLGLTSLGKQAVVACPDPMRVELSSFIGANKVTDTIAKRNFVVSLDYTEGMIEKVSYNIEGDKFNLVVETRDGFEPFSPDKVSYSMAGSAADLIITVDTIHLGGLKSLYETEKELFAGKTIINIDRHQNNSQYGIINFQNPAACSTSELVAEVLSGIGVKLSVDIATNLLNGIYGATNNFTAQGISPRAFEVAAVCTRAGGKRFVSVISGEAETPVTEMKVNTASVSTNVPESMQKPIQQQYQLKPNIPFEPLPQTVSQSKPVQQAPIQDVRKTEHPSQTMKPQFSQQEESSGNEQSHPQKRVEEHNIQPKPAPSTPDDWLKPKIFKSRDVN